MAENNLLTGSGVNQIASPAYPTFQPMQQPNPLAQVNALTQTAQGIQNLQQQQFELGKARTMFVQDRLGSLLTKPDLSFKDASDMVENMVRNNMIPASEAPQILVHFPTEPTALRAAIKQSYLSTLDHANRMQLGFGQQTMVNVGGENRFGVTDQMNPGQPQFAGGTVLPNTMSPAEKIAGQPAVVNNVPVSIPNVSRFGPTGNVLPTPSAPQAGAGAASNMAPQGMAGAPAGAVQTGQAPGVAQAANAAGEGSGAQMAEDLRASGNYKQSANALQQAVPLLEQLGPTGTGLGTEAIQKLRSLLVTAGAPASIANSDTAKLYDEARKYLTQNTLGLGQAGTNDKLAAAFSASPNVGINNAAATDLAKVGVSLNRLRQAQTLQAISEGITPDKYAQWAAQWNTQQDPRAYGFDLMKRDAQKKLLDSLQPNSEEAKRFVASHRAAIAHGLIAQPSGQ